MMPQDLPRLVPPLTGVPVPVDQRIEAADHDEHGEDVAAHVVEEVLVGPFALEEESDQEERRAGDDDYEERSPHHRELVDLLDPVGPGPVELGIEHALSG